MALPIGTSADFLPDTAVGRSYLKHPNSWLLATSTTPRIKQATFGRTALRPAVSSQRNNKQPALRASAEASAKLKHQPPTPSKPRPSRSTRSRNAWEVSGFQQERRLRRLFPCSEDLWRRDWMDVSRASGGTQLTNPTAASRFRNCQRAGLGSLSFGLGWLRR